MLKLDDDSKIIKTISGERNMFLTANFTSIQLKSQLCMIEK